MNIAVFRNRCQNTGFSQDSVNIKLIRTREKYPITTQIQSGNFSTICDLNIYDRIFVQVDSFFDWKMATPTKRYPYL